MPPEAVEALKLATIFDKELSSLRVLAKAMSSLWKQSKFANLSAPRLRDLLFEERSSSDNQDLIVKAAAEFIADLPIADRLSFISSLREAWKSEIEPEIRYQLARQILMAIRSVSLADSVDASIPTQNGLFWVRPEDNDRISTGINNHL